MTDAEWLGSLRKRTHELANVLQAHESRLIRSEERQTELIRKMAKLEELSAAVAELKHQAAMLRRAVGFVAAVAIGCLIKLL